MARDEDWQHEVRDALRREDWALNGPKRVVKVVPLSYRPASTATLYICLEKVLVGKTPPQIGELLGAKTKFNAGVRVYRLLRLPLSHEVEYDLTAKYPAGLAYNPAMHDAEYPPGAEHVHQWVLLADLPAKMIVELQPTQTYPSLHR